mmetsp:Transcript_6199/g.24847  ORF Transcript_6199/g.24847 Transcript_6199/m.24847 type:complete len:242 (+) Transcript_6199:800-1525(+)
MRDNNSLTGLLLGVSVDVAFAVRVVGCAVKGWAGAREIRINRRRRAESPQPDPCGEVCTKNKEHLLRVVALRGVKSDQLDHSCLLGQERLIDCRVWSQGAVSCFGSAGEGHVPRRRAEVAHLHVCAYGRPEEARVLDAEYWAHLELPTAASARVELQCGIDRPHKTHADVAWHQHVNADRRQRKHDGRDHKSNARAALALPRLQPLIGQGQKRYVVARRGGPRYAPCWRGECRQRHALTAP